MPQNPSPSLLDQQQILQRVFDQNNDTLRTNAFVQVDTINADLNVDIKAINGDNIAIANQDGTNPLHINTDGSINVNLVTGSLALVNTYNEVTNIPSNSLTTILSKTMTVSGSLIATEISGTNIAEYTVQVNASTISKARTSFGSSLNHFFDFKSGILLSPGDVIQISVIHTRPFVGDFNARMETTA